MEGLTSSAWQVIDVSAFDSRLSPRFLSQHPAKEIGQGELNRVLLRDYPTAAWSARS